MKASTVSISGQRTDDNRDVLLTELNHGIALYMLVDGSSSRAQSGEFAKHLVESITHGFQALTPEQVSASKIKETLIGLLKASQLQVRQTYPAASASLNMVAITGSVALTLYLGDCLLGRLNKQQKIKWLTQPHCSQGHIEIEKLALIPERNLLTKSAKARRFESPQWKVIALRQDQKLILASDGFWADLTPSQQIELIQTKQLHEAPNDDTSFMIIEQ